MNLPESSTRPIHEVHSRPKPMPSFVRGHWMDEKETVDRVDDDATTFSGQSTTITVLLLSFMPAGVRSEGGATRYWK